MRPRNMLRAACVALLAIALVAVGNINTNGQKGVVRTLSAKTLGRASLNVGLGINYAQSSTFLDWHSHPTELSLATLSERDPAKFLSSNVFLGLGLTSFWDIAVATPFYWDGVPGISEFGIGDIEFSTKLLYPKPTKPRVFYQSYVLSVIADVAGMSDQGILPRHGYYYENNDDTAPTEKFSLDGFAAKGMLVWTFDVGAAKNTVPLQIDVNLGGVVPFNGNAIVALGNLALEYSPIEVLTVYVDLASEIRANKIINSPETIPGELIWITPGLRINSPAGVFVNLGADFGLSPSARGKFQRTYTREVSVEDNYRYSIGSVPPVGIQFAMGWTGYLSAQDDDNDGIKNDNDRCPKDPEDVDGFEDSDGCPDADNDKDGIEDVKDKCPNKEEDTDGFEDEDGCPDVDNDGDGRPDTKDQCPNLAEDFDGFEDADGCPDPDNDKDAIPDSLDKCPNDIEDFDKFQDDDGCPDVDNDKDGIPDLKDKCPNEPETFNNNQDEDGCPDEKPEQKKSSLPKHQILHGIVFKSGRADLSYESYQYLDPIIKELREYPEIKIEIRGHTDSLGKYATNMKLSQMRADAVKQYMTSKGIDPRRLRAVGFGPSSPIADNRTAAGRAKNRRIEIVRIN